MKDFLESWKRRAGELKIEVYTIYLAYKNPRVPWYARIFAACVIAYAFSPIDLIPDPIPILGYLDDLVLVPLGLLLAMKMIPKDVLVECQERAQNLLNKDKPTNKIAAVVIVLIWLALLALILVWMVKILWHWNIN